MDESQQWVSIEGSVGPDGNGAPGAGKHIVFISGDEEYRSEEALPMLAQVMARHHGFRCSVLFAIDPQTGKVDPEVQTNIPGMHLLDDADMVVILLRFRELPDADMQHFVDYVFSGKPVLALRTSTHAFSYSRNPHSRYAKYHCEHEEYVGGFGRQVLGETWVAHHGHHGYESTRGMPNAALADHPVLAGVDPIWCPTDVYAAQPPADVEMIVHGHVLTGMDPGDGEKPDTPTMPVAWLRQPNSATGAGRIFCSTMGASVDLKDAALRRLVVNGIYWCLGMEPEISLQRSVDPVGAYEPTYFGFGKHVAGRRPQEYFV
jgi:type 1 glutamine amidotransferase